MYEMIRSQSPTIILTEMPIGTRFCAFVLVLLLCHLAISTSIYLISSAVFPRQQNETSTSCEELCTYENKFKTADCRRRNLTAIPTVGKCVNAEFLDVSANEIRTIAPGAFNGYASLRIILLGRNKLNDLPTKLWDDNTKALQLQINDNNLTRLRRNVFANLLSLRSLFLDRNRIREVQKGAFNGLFRLRSLYLLYNNISFLPSTAFRHLKALTTLNLSNNRMTRLRREVIMELTLLQRLDLSNNKMVVVDSDAFIGSIHLLWISLAGNNLVHVPLSTFDSAISLKTVFLSKNEIFSLVGLNNFLFQHTELRRFTLSGNPLNCDCSLEPLRVWYKIHDPIEEAVCGSPTPLTGFRLTNLNDSLCFLGKIGCLETRITEKSTGSSYRLAIVTSSVFLVTVVATLRIVILLFTAKFGYQYCFTKNEPLR